MVIKNISYEILDKTKLTTDILLKFEDNRISREQYSSIKDILNNFNLIIDLEYSTSLDSKYDESKKLLLIEMILSISDLIRPKDIQLEQIINNHTYRFTKFYERNIQHNQIGGMDKN
jgi:hypothetical protein